MKDEQLLELFGSWCRENKLSLEDAVGFCIEQYSKPPTPLESKRVIPRKYTKLKTGKKGTGKKGTGKNPNKRTTYALTEEVEKIYRKIKASSNKFETRRRYLIPILKRMVEVGRYPNSVIAKYLSIPEGTVASWTHYHIKNRK